MTSWSLGLAIETWQVRHLPKGVQKSEQSHPADSKRNLPRENIQLLSDQRRLISEKRECAYFEQRSRDGENWKKEGGACKEAKIGVVLHSSCFFMVSQFCSISFRNQER